MIRTTVALLTIAAILVVAGCGVGNDFPVVDNPTITVTDATDTTISISWQPAANESSVGRGYQYEVYTSASTMTSPGDLDSLTPEVTAPADELGENPLAATIGGLTVGTGYHINVAVVNLRSGDLELYDDVIGVTSGVGQILGDTYTGTVPYFNHSVDTAGASTVVEYTIDPGALSDIYIVFSNPAAADLVRPEILLGSLSEIDPPAWSAANIAPPTPPSARSVTPTGPIILRDRPEIADWQAPEFTAASRGIAPPPPPPSYDEAGVSTAVFHDDGATTIAATCRAVVTIDETTLNIWVEDSAWSDLPTAPNGKIDQDMVDFLAASFLAAGTDNDIFDWVTNVYGDEWGTHSYSNLITNNNEITILLWDIGEDGQAGGTVGYFWAKDNYLQTSVPYSNQRIMFYIDSASLGTRDGLTWDPADDWPSEMVVTLAHEFQHMIHFYQRDILLGADTQTWLNEMMSLVSEDLVGRKLYTDQGLDIRGPRGVLPSWGTESGGAGDSNNDYGRLPRYNANPSINLTTWLSGDDVLKSYSITYAFGAFLSRNFGGADLFGAMMDSASSVSETVISSVTGVTMDDLLWKWGVSVLLSDDVSAPPEVQMNTGAWIDPATTLTGYDLGSINHFNYDQYGSSVDGPVIHTASSYPLAEMEGMSTIFYELGLGQTGALTATLLVPKGVDFTVVVK